MYVCGDRNLGIYIKRMQISVSDKDVEAAASGQLEQWFIGAWRVKQLVAKQRIMSLTDVWRLYYPVAQAKKGEP